VPIPREVFPGRTYIITRRCTQRLRITPPPHHPTEVDFLTTSTACHRKVRVSLPREVLPGRTYMITRRCTQRQFLMRPDRETNNAFIYCLSVAAQRSGIEVLFTAAMSNHHHTGIYDPHGNYPTFIEHFHKLFAKCQNPSAVDGRTSGLPSRPASYASSTPTMSSTR
jgi:hypothetical protein